MRVLIAGCGYVGNPLASSLMIAGHEVHGLKRDTSTLPDGVRPVQADLLNPDTLTELPAPIDALVFMPSPASRDQGAYEAIFIHGLKNLWTSLQVEPARTLLVSSTAVYGESNGAVIDEETLPGPGGFNGKVLLKMEQLGSSFTDNLVCVRFSGIYGPGREGLVRLAASEGLEIQKHPPYFTNRIHRDDAAAVLQHLLTLENAENLYIATDNLPAPRYEVIEWLAKAQGKPAPSGLSVEQASRGKRLNNQKLRDSGITLTYPDYRAGYASVLKNRGESYSV